MAVTRIKNNQITDATIVASSKLVDYSISAAKIANNLTYGSNLTVAGNLTVQGNTTAIDTNITTIEDPVILLASTQTGAPAVDIGFIGQRGTGNNIAFVWDESAQTFVTVFTDTPETATTINILAYANLATLNANVTAGLTVAGQSNIANLTVAANSIVSFGNVVISNVADPVANTDAATKAYVLSTLGNSSFAISDGTTTEAVNGGDTIDFDGTTDQITVNVASVSANTSSVTVALATNVSVVGNVTVGNILTVTGTVNSNLVPTTTATYNLGASGALWKDLYLAGNSIYIGDQSITSNATAITLSNAVATGDVYASGNVSATGTGTFGNVNTGGAVSATSTITGGNLATGGTVSAAGTGTFGNVATGGTITATGTATLGNVDTGGTVSATGNGTFGNVSAVGAVTGASASVSGNITGGNLATGGTISSTGMATLGNVESGGTISGTGNITGGNILTGGISSATGNVLGGNILTGGLISATGNGTFGNLSTVGTFQAASLSATGNVTGGNLISDGIISSTGTATLGNVATGGTVSAVGTITGGNVDTGGTVSSTGNITGGNVLTGGLISATGNITSAGLGTFGNVNVNGFVSATGNVTGEYVIANVGFQSPSVTITSTSANSGISLVTNGTGNINVNTSFINGVKDPEQAQDAATKSYVDAVAQGLDLKASVHVGTYATLPAYVYNNGTSGVGATLTGNVAGNLTIDGEVVASGQRVLVKNETGAFVNNSTPSAAFNGIYVVTTAGAPGTAYVLTRAVDFDIPAEMYGAFTFVETGNIQADTGWVCTNNSASPITIGTTEIIWAQFSGAGQYTAGNALSLNGTQFNVNTDGSANATIGINGSNQLIIPASATLTTPNIGAATGTSLTATGNVDAGNVLTGGLVSATGTGTFGNVNTGGAVSAGGNVTGTTFVGNVAATTVSASGNITGGNLATGGTISSTGTATLGNVDTGGTISATGNIDSGNIRTTGTVSATGDVAGGNILTGGLVSATGNITGGNITSNGNFDTVTISATGNIKGGNLQTGGTVSSTGTATLGNVETGGTVSATGNITGGNILTSGDISGSGNITGGNILTGGTVSSTGTATLGNVATGGTVSAAGNITAGAGSFFLGNGSQLTGVDANSAIALINGNTNITTATNGNANVTISGTSNVVVFTTGGIDVTGTVSANGTVTGGNLDTGGTVSATGNATAGNVLTGGVVSAGGNVTGVTFVGNVEATTVSATGNVTGQTFIGNVEATTVSATGNITGGNIITGGFISITGNVDAGNVIATSGKFGNIVISGDDITDTNGIVNINSALADVNFAVNGDTVANLLFVDAGTDTVSVGSATQTTGAILAINATNSILFPVGNTAQRPTGVVGMLRYNTSVDSLEQYSVSGWNTVGTPAFTVIADNQFNGDGSTVAFTLTQAATTAGTIVAINGVQQIPTTAYSISTTTLTFTEAPAAGDVIDVRMFTITTSVTSISNPSGNAIVGTSETANVVSITGDLLPVANNTQSLGSASKYWNSLYVSGNTIYLGNLQLKEASANTFAVYTSDGVTEANIAVGNIDVTSIQSGTSSISITAPNGNAVLNAAGNNTVIATSTGANITGYVNATGNLTAGNVSATNIAGIIATPSQTNITGVGTLGSLSVTGTVTAGNLTVGTGTITGGNIVNSNGNGIGNIGSSSVYFNTVFAKATSAQYADLAEKYEADAEYAPGTVLAFGGNKEVTLSTEAGSTRVAGVVSTNPSYIMNAGLTAEHVAMVALQGRVPCRVIGPVAKGDMMVAAGNGAARVDNAARAGSIIGKALENFDGAEGTIEVVIGRN